MMNNYELKIYSQWDCHFLYDLYINEERKGQVEVQFDNGEFNGHILYTDFDSEDENGEFTWESVEDKELYNFIKEKAIKDYTNTFAA